MRRSNHGWFPGPSRPHQVPEAHTGSDLERASVCRIDAHPQAKDDCVKALATCHQNDSATGRLLRTECAQVDVTSARKQDPFGHIGGRPTRLPDRRFDVSDDVTDAHMLDCRRSEELLV
jgi:hypothetical protein